ncbi:uncharacterized protein [Diadema antillarum]|uniref:uncharacterized protein n=1 Tax=Diadema antillarum TaxID=105358 RepID=UPI003A86E8B0
MAKPLKGKVCLVTGATRGIGKGIALQLGGAGATVYITGRTLRVNEGSIRGSLEETAKEVAERGGKCIPIQCDHAHETEVEAVFERIKREQNGRLDILVNNAFSAVHAITQVSGTPFWEQPTQMWDEVNNVGLRNHYVCTVHAAKLMVPAKQGLIVNISSIGAIRYHVNVLYGVGKAAVDKMAFDCAHELKEHNVTVVSLWPGAVRTEYVEDTFTDPDMIWDIGDVKVTPFHQKSSWIPPKNRVPSLETYIEAVSSQVHSADTLDIASHDNLPKEERQALSSLKNRSDIIIKPADKGSAVVVMDRQQYIDEAMKHLRNPSHYTLLDFDPTNNFSQQIQSTLDDMKEHEHLTKKAHKFLSPVNAKPARFYLLPKIHKPGNPGRPILSGNGSPTENISLFVDHHIKPLVSLAPSYIHDTPDFLRKLDDIKDQIPETAIIGTFDVSSLYTNIPHDEGILASCEALTYSGHSNPSISHIKSLMSHVLTKNNFTFMDKHYLQVSGTAMFFIIQDTLAVIRLRW